MSRPTFAGDLSRLPDHAFGHRSLTWWGVMGFITVEAAGFALAAGAYFYLANQVPRWPPDHPPPDLLWSGLFTALLLLSEVPNVWLKKAAEGMDLRRTRLGLVAVVLAGAVLLGIRALEFTTLNVRWDENAYGSILWALLLLHTVHLLTDWVDTGVLAALMFTRHVNPRRFVDTSENALYWHFVVLTWLPVYAILYWAPRWM
ncbi:MAG TPA: cytochrome c oxidase subunit 3 [Azospirillaceae bacterium]|nr:cytochrome c oxidase subunit 3 [Azospirillaceae bacterium]